MGDNMEFIKRQWKVILATSIVTLFVVFGIWKVDRFLSSTSFCLSCHSMSYTAEELRKSTHYGAAGINPGCKDCHLPPCFILRAKSHLIDGTRAFIGELKKDLSTKEAFDKHRAKFAHNARINLKKWDSSPCRRCHKKPVPSSEEAAEEHKKMETEGLTCIDCHQNLVHEEVPEEDLNEGLRQGKIVLKEKKEDN